MMDGVRRIAMVETKTIDDDAGGAFQVTTVTRFQLGNHLGSASLEVDASGLVISYEEYHPYGTTAYWSASSAVEVSRKRYRYTGKEKDEETGLYYHGARYYACWLGRWTAADPAGLVDGVGLYTYVRGNPTRLIDPSGRNSTVNEQIAQMTDVQLHRHLAGLSAEGRASFAGSATGKFAERAWATLNRGGMAIGYSFPSDTIVAAAPPKRVAAHEASPQFVQGSSPCPTCHGVYGAPLPRATVGDDPVIVAYALGSSMVGAMLGDDSGVGAKADARRAAVAAFDEDPNSTPAEAKALPTRVSPTGEAVLNVAALKGPQILAKFVGRGIKADAAVRRAKFSPTGMFRRTANTGPFAELKVPMQMRHVKAAAQQAGVGLKGVKIQIIRDPSLVGRQLYGYTPPRGTTIQLYPDAFTDIEQLVKTLGHERTHVMQIKIFGAPTDVAELGLHERAAAGIEETFWQYFLEGAKK
jgi:RHS repeat-associated protein